VALDSDQDRAGADLHELIGCLRRLAFDSSLPPADAMARIRDLLREHDRRVTGNDE